MKFFILPALPELDLIASVMAMTERERIPKLSLNS
jgi:hypothetical protein